MRRGPVLVLLLWSRCVLAAGGLDADCLSGAYANAGGALILTRSEGELLRYREVDSGRTGQLRIESERVLRVGGYYDGFDNPRGTLQIEAQDCSDIQLTSSWQRDRRDAYRKLNFETKDLRFDSGDGTELLGRFVLPASPGPHRYVVIVHGSGRNAALTHYYHQYLFPLYGVAAFVYDKRGTGGSGGKFTSDFERLADDAVAALDLVLEQAPQGVERVGFAGYSQGGWIAPLAAQRAGERVAFVQVHYGLADTPLYEDRAQALAELRQAGFDDEALREANLVIDAAHEARLHGFKEGIDALRDVRRRFGKRPWFDQLQGEFTGNVLRWPPFLVGLIGPWVDDSDLPWDFDPRPILAGLQVPLLWVVAEQDREAPPESTIEYLRGLAQRKPSLDLRIYPRTDHGVLEFETDAHGARRYTRYAPGYFPMQARWILQLEP